MSILIKNNDLGGKTMLDNSRNWTTIPIAKALHSEWDGLRREISVKLEKTVSWQDFEQILFDCAKENLTKRLENKKSEN